MIIRVCAKEERGVIVTNDISCDCMIYLDIETFSSVELTACGVYKYAEAPDFEIPLIGYSVDGGEVRVIDLASGESCLVKFGACSQTIRY